MKSALKSTFRLLDQSLEHPIIAWHLSTTYHGINQACRTDIVTTKPILRPKGAQAWEIFGDFTIQTPNPVAPYWR